MGAEEEFRHLYAEYYEAVLRYAWRRVGADAAADVAAEVFTTAWRHSGRLPAGAELPWLYATARNAVANHERGRHRAERLHARLAEEVPDVRDVAEGIAEQQSILRAWAALSEPDRELLALIGWEGLSLRAAAAALGCTAATCSVRLHRARGRLRSALRADTEGEATTARIGREAPACD